MMKVINDNNRLLLIKIFTFCYQFQSMASHTKDEMTGTTCTTCNIGQSANVFCLDCKEHLCQSCHTSHKAFRAMRHHKIVAIEDLKSGTVVPLSSISPTEDQHCSKHEGETKRFYCKTCVKLVCRDCVVMKNCCRDHQYITLSEAAQEQTNNLKRLLDQGKAKQRQCEDAILETEKVEDDFKTAARACQESVGKMRGEYIAMLERILSTHENDLRMIEIEKSQKLYSLKTDLATQLDRVKHAIDVATAVTKMGTDYEIVSRFRSLSQDLQRLIRSQPVLPDDSLSQINVRIPIVTFHSSTPWRNKEKFNPKSRVYYPRAIAIHSDGDIAVASTRNVQVFSRAGSLLYTFKAAASSQVIVTSDKKYLLNTPEGISCFDFPNKHKSTIQITDDRNQMINPASIAVDPNGHIIAASGSSEGSQSWFGYVSSMIITSTHQEPRISIHQPDGAFISSFKTGANTRYVAVTANHDIVATTDDNSLQLMNYSGNNIRILAPPPDVQRWFPHNVYCHMNNLFVVNHGDPMAVYAYTISGIYLGLVASLEGFQPPIDVAYSADGVGLLHCQ